MLGDMYINPLTFIRAKKFPHPFDEKYHLSIIISHPGTILNCQHGDQSAEEEQCDPQADAGGESRPAKSGFWKDGCLRVVRGERRRGQYQWCR